MFTKLHSQILDSTIWLESSSTRILWITMLAMADQHGEVMASIPGLARRANIPLEDCKAGLEVLMGPDEYSRTPDDDGRRIVVIDGGWQILNYQKYREKGWEEEQKRKKRERQQRYRDKSRVAPRGATVARGGRKAEAEAEVKETASAVVSKQVADVVDYYQQLHPRSKPGKKEKRLLRMRLDEGYSVSDLKNAIDGNHISPHHCGQNDTGTKYHKLSLIMRDSDQVATFIETFRNPPNPQHLTYAVKKEQNTLNAIQSFMGGDHARNGQAALFGDHGDASHQLSARGDSGDDHRLLGDPSGGEH